MLEIAARRGLKIMPLAAVIFLTVSGGPYGLEPLLNFAGANAAIPLLVITPLLWDVPTILMVMELNGMMPVTGGYYQWVKRALGIRWAWYEGWWTWLYTFVDLAIYPVLFVGYLSFFFPAAPEHKFIICLVIIWSGALFNILGIMPVGRLSMILAAIVIIPFATMIGIHISRTGWHPPPISFRQLHFSSFGMALYTIMWNFIGWDNVTTYAGEVNEPKRTYRTAIALAFGLIFTLYLLSTYVAIGSGIGMDRLQEEGFPAVASIVAGNWMGLVMAAGGMASAVGLFSAVLLSVSRIPKVMSDDKLLPAFLHRLHSRFQTPYISILLSAAIVSVMVIFTFGDLLIIDISLYGGGLALEFIALVVMRRKFPLETRPFRIPFGNAGVCVVAFFPLLVYLLALTAAVMMLGRSPLPVGIALACLLSAEAGWQLVHRRKRPGVEM